MKRTVLHLLLVLGLGGCATPTLVPVRNEVRFSLSAAELQRARTPPMPVSMPQPVYPFRLHRANIVGEAVIHFIVGTDGRPTEVQCERANDIAFAEAAKAAVAQWVFRPAERDGVPVPMKMIVPIQFTIGAD